PDVEALLEQRSGSGQIAQILGMHSQRIQSDSDTPGVIQPASDVHALRNERTTRGVVALLPCQYARREKHTCARIRAVHSAFQLKKLPESVAAFSEMFTHIPELKQCRSQPQPPFCVAGLRKPFECGKEIVMLQLEGLNPVRMRRIGPPRCAVLRDHQAKGGMRTTDVRFLATGAQSLKPVLPNRVEHDKTRFPLHRFDLLNKALVDQRSHSL